MTHLVPIKIKIGLRANGHADHPPFNNLSADVRGNTDWSYYIDKHGSGGLHYDKVSGHKECDINNDDVTAEHEHRNDELGCQFACLLVPTPFAEAAVSMFSGEPYQIKIISEESFEVFYNDRAHAHEDEELVDRNALQNLNERIKAGDDSLATQTKKVNALDPNHPERGVKKNHRKKWVDFKKQRGLEIRETERKSIA